MFVGLGDFIRLLRSPEYCQGIAELKAENEKRAQTESSSKVQGLSLESSQTAQPSSHESIERGH